MLKGCSCQAAMKSAGGEQWLGMPVTQTQHKPQEELSDVKDVGHLDDDNSIFICLSKLNKTHFTVVVDSFLPFLLAILTFSEPLCHMYTSSASVRTAYVCVF